MLKQVYDYVRQLLSVKHQTEQNTDDIRDLRQELKELTAAVQVLAFEVRRNQENDTHEREKMLLRLENALLKFERRLPPGKRVPDVLE
jgi:hypothetical protein